MNTTTTPTHPMKNRRDGSCCKCGGKLHYCSPACQFCLSDFCDACGRADAARSGSPAMRLVAIDAILMNKERMISAADVVQFAADVHAFLLQTPRPPLLPEYRAGGEQKWRRIAEAVNHLHQTMCGGTDRMSARLAVARPPPFLLCVPAHACVSAMKYLISRIEAVFTELDDFTCSACGGGVVTP